MFCKLGQLNRVIEMFFYYDTEYHYTDSSDDFAMAAQGMVKSNFSRYGKVRNGRNMTGAEAARRVLDENGLRDVAVRQIRGSLTDNYDPRTKVLSLSEDVYGVNSVSAVSVACHEAGHAIQHARGYIPLKIRNGIVPVVNFASKLTWPLLLIGIVLFSSRQLRDELLGKHAVQHRSDCVYRHHRIPSDYTASGV